MVRTPRGDYAFTEADALLLIWLHHLRVTTASHALPVQQRHVPVARLPWRAHIAPWDRTLRLISNSDAPSERYFSEPPSNRTSLSPGIRLYRRNARMGVNPFLPWAWWLPRFRVRFPNEKVPQCVSYSSTTAESILALRGQNTETQDATQTF